MGKLKLFLLLKQERGFSGKRPETMLPLASVVLGSQTRERIRESLLGFAKAEPRGAGLIPQGHSAPTGQESGSWRP